ncbi:hypothetical protein [Brevibacillus sp. 179-C9.3 HS]|uniref:hypothetical protein n=1 Tax=unclassified Brevibacillus TaxID=2684853 RepID=UPI0039A07190
MFEWVEEVEEPQITCDNVSGELKIRRVESTLEPHEMSEVCQLFAAYSVITGMDAMSQFPTPNEVAKNLILTEIVPHYTDVKEIYYDGVLQRINVHGIEPSSRKIIQDKLFQGIYPVVTDLYRSKNLNLATSTREVKYYRVRKEAIRPLYTRETEKVGYFFQHTFFAESGSVFLAPTGWTFENELRESFAIRTFCVFARSLILVVDTQDNCVIGLDIYG